MVKTLTFTPKDLARAVAASESSIKRWIDQGKLPASKTAGGHRRIALADAFRFIRETGQQLVDPSALGLTSAEAIDFTNAESVRSEYLRALETGQEPITTSLVSHLHLLDKRIADICDDPMHASFLDIRSRCSHPSEECVVLHRSFANTIRAGQRLRDLEEVPPVDGEKALLADIGYEIDGLPTHLAEVVLTSLGMRCTQMGANVPGEVLTGAITRVRPALLWISASGAQKVDRSHVRRTISEALQLAALQHCRVVLMGDAIPRRQELAEMKQGEYEPTVVASMAELAAFTVGVLGEKVEVRPANG